MTRISLLLLALSFVSQLSAQQLPNEPISLKADYLKRSKGQQSAGWVLTGLGTTGLIVTLLSDASQAVSGGFVTVVSLGSVQPEYKSHTVPYLLSAASVIGGITLLTAASKNKRKARTAQVYMDLENLKVVPINGLDNRSFPVMGLKIQL